MAPKRIAVHNVKMDLDLKEGAIVSDNEDTRLIFNNYQSTKKPYLLKSYPSGNEECLKIYTLLTNATTPFLPKPIPLMEFHMSSILAIPKPPGSTLVSFLKTPKNCTKLIEFNDEDKPIRISQFYKDLLISIVDSIHELQEGGFKAWGQPEHIYIVEGVRPYITCTRFLSCENKAECWKWLGQVVDMINKKFAVETQVLVKDWMHGFTCLEAKHKNIRHLVLEMPIFWTWEQHAMFILRLVDKMKARPECWDETAIVSSAFEGWGELVRTDKMLSELKASSDKKGNELREDTMAKGLREAGDLGAGQQASTFIVRYNAIGVTPCLFMMRNSLCHIDEKKSQDQVSIPNAKKCVDLFNVSWPRHLAALYKSAKHLHIEVGKY